MFMAERKMSADGAFSYFEPKRPPVMRLPALCHGMKS